MAPLRASVSSDASMTGTGPSLAAGTTGTPLTNLTLVTAFPYAAAHLTCWSGGAAL